MKHMCLYLHKKKPAYAYPVADPGFYIGGFYNKERALCAREIFKTTPIFADHTPFRSKMACSELSVALECSWPTRIR